MSAKDFFSPLQNEVLHGNKKVVSIFKRIVTVILLLPPTIYSFYATKFIYVIISIVTILR